MTWTKNGYIIGNETCTQFQNTVQDELNPQTAYQTAPFINTNTTTSQTITFNYFDTMTYTTLSNTKVVTATASSGLTVTLESLDINIATITGGFTINAHTAGRVFIKATQAGNSTYDPATPIYCIFDITFQEVKTGPTGKIASPIVITTTCALPYLKQIAITIDDIRYTKYSGISYGWATGFHGSATIGSISAIDKDDIPITSFTSNPINITINMANADTSHPYKIYKRINTALEDPQPVGYPVTLTYQSGNNWTGSMTALSDIIVLDENPPTGNAGGDPYIISVKKIKTLLPNDWKTVTLLKTDTTHIIAHCEYLTDDIMHGLHYINKNQQACLLINPELHKWVRDITYITSIDVIQNDKKLVVNTIDGQIISDNSSILYEKVSSKYGLYSLTHHGYYPPVSFKKYVFHFDEGSITLSIDNFWDDINFIELYMNDTEYDKYSGELIEHNENNKIE